MGNASTWLFDAINSLSGPCLATFSGECTIPLLLFCFIRVESLQADSDGMLITSYETYKTNVDSITSPEASYEVVIFDEAHKLKSEADGCQ